LKKVACAKMRRHFATEFSENTERELEIRKTGTEYRDRQPACAYIAEAKMGVL